MRDQAQGGQSPYADNAVSGEQVTGANHAGWTPRTLLLPWRVGFRRAVGEALLGWFVCVTLAGLAQPDLSPRFFYLYHASFNSAWSLLTLIGWIWAVIWPIWRLRPARSRWRWSGVPKAVARIWLLGLVVGLVTNIADLSSGASNDFVTGRAIGFMFLIIVPMTFLRTAMNVAILVRRWTRTRLRRQLMVSHLLVIMMTFVGLVGVGSITAVLLAINNLPNPTSQARAIAGTLQPGPGGNAINPARTRILLQELEAGRLRPDNLGGSPLSVFMSWTTINRRTEVVDTKDHVLAAVNMGPGDSRCIEPQPSMVAPAGARARLLRAALEGKTTSVAIPVTTTCTGNGVNEYAAAAPILGSRGQPIAVVLVRGVALTPTSSQVLSVALFGFTAASFALIMVTVLPTLALSSLAAMYFARGLTRRIGAVSRAASSLSAGDLTQRVQVSAHNEIGRLAEDFNRMAGRLEHIMGELRTARTQAEEALQSRQELVASVSHELRTPIAIVQAHLEALRTATAANGARDGAIPAATMQALQSEMDRLTTLVDDLFTLARAGTNAMDVRCAPTDIGGVAREVAALLRPLAQREGALTLTVETQPGLPLALADGDRLRQILANLVRNAVRHTPEGGIIALGAAAEGEWLVLSVADTGEGIAPEHLPRIFDRFYRVDKARTRASGGAGLGLAIVKEFVELMGGHVTVESKLNEGTIFRVYLPRAGSPIEAPIAAQV